MTLSKFETVKCAVCGKKSNQCAIMSTNTFGGTPDLDWRPAEMMRSTMPLWIQECPNCGYVSGSLDDKTRITRKWLAKEHYTSCAEHIFLSELAERFYKYYLINLACANDLDAFYAALHAAWACDDNLETENAKHCRECALAELEKILASPECTEDLLAVKADLLRRTEQFDTLVSTYDGMEFSDDLINQIIAYQIDKAKQRDTRCYRIEDVTSSGSY